MTTWGIMIGLSKKSPSTRFPGKAASGECIGGGDSETDGDPCRPDRDAKADPCGVDPARFAEKPPEKNQRKPLGRKHDLVGIAEGDRDDDQARQHQEDQDRHSGRIDRDPPWGRALLHQRASSERMEAPPRTFESNTAAMIAARVRKTATADDMDQSSTSRA